ncbi:MAG TPA: HEPN domain-containing protein [Kofleriaceae bacterium]
MSVEKRVRAYLELATKDVEAAELLLAGANRYAAYHVQQSVEKVTKALLLARGIEAGIEHRLEELCKRFADSDAWPERLRSFVGYSAYATAFRYPTPGGRIPADPPAEDLRRDMSALRALLAAVRVELLGTA